MVVGRPRCRASADVSHFGSSNATPSTTSSLIVDIPIINNYAAFLKWQFSVSSWGGDLRPWLIR